MGWDGKTRRGRVFGLGALGEVTGEGFGSVVSLDYEVVGVVSAV